VYLVFIFLRHTDNYKNKIMAIKMIFNNNKYKTREAKLMTSMVDANMIRLNDYYLLQKHKA
jgi:hypothetical protein